MTIPPTPRRSWLRLCGHNVQVARDGYQAIEIARHQRPDFVLLDLGLPGWMAIRLPQHFARNWRVAPDHRHYRLRSAAGPSAGLTAGCDHFILKPIDLGSLITLLSLSDTCRDVPIEKGSRPRQ